MKKKASRFVASEDLSSAGSDSSTGFFLAGRPCLGRGLAPSRRTGRQRRDRGVVRQRIAARRGAGKQELPDVHEERQERPREGHDGLARPHRRGCRRRASPLRPSSQEWSAEALSQNQVGKKQTMQNALIQGKIPMSIVSQMPKWRLMKASAVPVRTGPVKNGQNSKIGPTASSMKVPKVSTCSKPGS